MSPAHGGLRWTQVTCGGRKAAGCWELFDKLGEGEYVPLFQQEYTLDEDNIDRLFDDLVLGAPVHDRELRARVVDERLLAGPGA